MLLKIEHDESVLNLAVAKNRTWWQGVKLTVTKNRTWWQGVKLVVTKNRTEWQCVKLALSKSNFVPFYLGHLFLAAISCRV